MATLNNNIKYVFGLDIGTRNMVGTVGYKTKDNRFVVLSQVTKEHQTRAMLDGQIHDIAKVSESIAVIRKELEEQTGLVLCDVCIAAAGRVLKTIRKKVDYEFGADTVVNQEHIYSLDMLGVEKAYEEIREATSDEATRYYCVGYSVVQYFLNDYAITVLEDHKASKIGVELIATFLPDEVVDGLYSAVEKAGLQVANLTLEPIAALNVAIPDNYRLLNIALVDVGAGTSDISIAKSGSIQAFGMMPYAGDEITEVIAAKYLIDFQAAEKIKKSMNRKQVKFKDIMGIRQTVTSDELKEAIADTVSLITRQVGEKILELNGDKPVSAVFIVGGGGKIDRFPEKLAEAIGIPKERVAIRGPEVMQQIEFQQEKVKKDSLMVTPIGICLNYYEQKNNFIPVTINGEHIKLYDNDKVCVVDAALQLGLANDYLFPKRGTELVFTVNGTKKMIRGQQGEAAIIQLNGREANMNSAIQANDNIVITESTKGVDASYEIGNLPEYTSVIQFMLNGKRIDCPKMATVNGELVPSGYAIQSGDNIEILNYYTLEQVLAFMDLPYYPGIMVNNENAGPEEKVFDNFKVEYRIQEQVHVEPEVHVEAVDVTKQIAVRVNEKSIQLQGKESYILVDILDYYPFDTTIAGGKRLVMEINQESAEFTSAIIDGDVISLYWEN